MENTEKIKNKIKTARRRFNLIGLLSLAAGLLMPLLLLLGYEVPAIAGALVCFAVGVNTFRAKSYYIKSLEKQLKGK